MKAEIISIGTELLLGHTINSDAALIARELAPLGIDLLNMQVVGDNAGRLETALETALARSDIVFTTGGLGPTEDDLTKETVARISGCPLEEDVESMRALKEYFGTRPMSPNQLKQAFLPAGSAIFPNSRGTAPGCAVSMPDGKAIILLPGPPGELQAMLERSALPWLEKYSGSCLVSFMIRTFGIGEGDAAARLGHLVDGSNPTVATYAQQGEMFVRVSAKGVTRQAAADLAEPVVARVRELIGDYVYGINVPSLESVVVGELARSNATVATAESCTGGLLAKRITDIPGSSAVFGTGLVTYSNSAKASLLSVPEGLLRKYGAVSPQVAALMSKNVMREATATYGVGISGIAGPDGGSAEKPVGLVYVAMSRGHDIWIRTMRPAGRYHGREWTRNMAASHALDMLRRHLRRMPLDAEPWRPDC